MIALAAPAFALALLGDPDRKFVDVAGMPTRICSGAVERDQPIWVASTSALDGTGRPDPMQLDAGGVNDLDWMLKEPEVNGCAEVGPAIFDGIAHDHDRGTLDGAAETATSILEGVVDGVAPGFFLGVAGQLYRVSPRRALKGDLNRDSYFFFLPIGRVPLGSKTLCAIDPNYPVAPGLGLRVLLMIDSLNGVLQEFFDLERPEDIVIERMDGTAAIAAGLARRQPDYANVTFDEFVAEIQARLDVITARVN